MPIYFDPEKDSVQHRGIGIPVTYSQEGRIYDAGKNYLKPDRKYEERQKAQEDKRQKELEKQHLAEAQNKLTKKSAKPLKGIETNNKAKNILNAMKNSPSNPTNVANASAKENVAAQLAEDSAE